MTTFKVPVPEEKTSFFLEVLDLIGATYESKEDGFQLTADQKRFLQKQIDVPIEECIPALDLYDQLKDKHGL